MNGKCVPVVHFSLVEASPILFPVVAAHLPFLQGPCYLLGGGLVAQSYMKAQIQRMADAWLPTSQ